MTTITEARAELARLEAETEAARKRVAELEREPLRLWVNVYERGAIDRQAHKEEASARAAAAQNATRIAVPMVELRPGWALVKVPTDEELRDAWDAVDTEATGLPSFRRLFVNALGLRESQS